MRRASALQRCGEQFPAFIDPLLGCRQFVGSQSGGGEGDFCCFQAAPIIMRGHRRRLRGGTGIDD